MKTLATTDATRGSSESIEAQLSNAVRLEATAPTEAVACYKKILLKDRANLAAHNAIEKLSPGDSYALWMRINCAIDPRDDIFHFFARHPIASNPIREYLTDGWRTLSELMLLLDCAGASLTHMDRVLEFAAGYGRFTRHLVKAVPGKVTCADVLPGTAEFLREQFKVDAFYSHHDPAAIVYPRQYDLVFVLSLFTHLPVHMWSAWLKSLARAVKPGGLLVLSVHNEAIAPHLGVSLGADGTFFVASSESPSIDGAVYGTTFTTRAFVESAIRESLGRAALFYQPYTFWGGQDGVVIRL